MRREPRTGMLRPGIRRLMGLDVPNKRAIQKELEDELQLHIELRTEQLVRSGIPRDLAVVQARERYGALDDARRDIRRYAEDQEQSMKRHIAFDSLAQDLRFALRMLGRQKAWTMLAIVTLALGIGANTAVFSVINDLLLDPMRYPQADRLVRVARRDAKSGFELSPTLQQLRAWRDARSLDGLEGTSAREVTLTIGDDPRTGRAAAISPTFVRFAGARMLLGRTFDSTETIKGASPVALLSEHLWRTQFGGDVNALGKRVMVDGRPHTIIGVLADGVRLPAFSADPADVWLPLRENTEYLSGPLIGRLARGATIASAKRELDIIARSIIPATKARVSDNFEVAMRAPGTTGSTRTSLFLLAGAVGLLLLVACANVAHLLLARGAAREREIAIRAALGAGKGRIARQLITESMLLAIAGCAAGIGIGYLALRVMIAMRPPNLSELLNVHIDQRVMAATIVLSVLSGIAFGLVASLRGAGARSFDMLRSSAAGSPDRRRSRLQSILVVSESALSVILLVGATLLIRTVMNLQSIDPGFDATNVFAVPMTLPETRYATDASRDLYASSLLAEARKLDGVVEATMALNVPTQAGMLVAQWVAEGAKEAPPGAGDFTAMNSVRPEYFQLMRMPITRGRTFDATSSTRREILVSESFAKQLWGTRDPVGLRVRSSFDSDWSTVIGTVKDAKLIGLGDQGNVAAIYFPWDKAGADFTLILRMRDDHAPQAGMARIAKALDKTMPPPTVLSLRKLLSRSIAFQLFIMSLLTLFAGLAVVLCAIGLYGVITYMVSQSTREIGIRMALGAARRDVVRLVLSKGLALSALGLAIGISASLWGTRLLQSSLYGVTATDPVSFLAGASVLLVLAVVACIGPTVRALRIGPLVAMRSE